MPTCSAYGCSTRSDVHGKKDGITFHRFPLDPTKRKLWEIAVRRANWAATKHSVLCSAHFEKECFIRTSKRVLLKENAVPSIFKLSRRRKRKTSKSLESQNSSSTISDEENTERNTQLEDSNSNLEMLSTVCCLLKPIRTDRFGDHAPKSEIQKLVGLLKHEIEILKSKLRVCENKVKKYKRKIIKVEQNRERRVKKKNSKAIKVIEILKQKNLLNDDLIDILQNITSSQIDSLKREIHISQATDPVT